MIEWLDCPACGEDAIESDSDGMFEDGQSARCPTCGTMVRVTFDGDSRVAGLGPHVTVVTMRAMFAAEREGLTRRASRNQVNRANRSEIKEPHVALVNLGPVRNWLHAALSVCTESIAGVGVPFDHADVLEPGQRNAHAEATGTCEQLDCFHR